MTRRLLVPALLALGLAAPGCFLGYTPVRYQGALADTRTVAIVPLVNESYEPGTESVVTDSIIREFERTGSLRLVTNREIADIVVTGAIEELLVLPRSFSSIQFALEFSLTLRLSLEVERRDGTEVPFDRRSLSDTELYFASADIEVTRKNKLEALRRASDVIAGRFHDSLFVRTVQ